MQTTALPRFYQIVDDARWLERFLPLGLELVQLRIKDQPEAELRAQISASIDMCRAEGATLIINDYWRLALELDADWVHLGQEDLDDADLSAISDGGLKLGLSTHDDTELERALVVEPDYVALGPIYPTILKKMRFGPQGLDRISEWKAKIDNLPLVAIGGITLEHAPEVFAAGADSICVVTDVLLKDDPEARLTQWLELAQRGG